MSLLFLDLYDKRVAATNLLANFAERPVWMVELMPGKSTVMLAPSVGMLLCTVRVHIFLYRNGSG